MNNLQNSYHFSTFAPDMIDERMFTLLKDQLSLARAEKDSLYLQIASLTDEIRMLRQENKAFQTQSKEDRLQDQTLIKEQQTALSSIQTQLEAANETIALLSQELTRERDRNANNNRKNYSRTSEQARLLNNREADKRSLEKQEFTGASSASSSEEPTKEEPAKEEPVKEEKKGKRKGSSKKEAADKFVGETITHKLADYHTLPQGGHYLTRNGEVELNYYQYTEYHPARVVRHLYEVARVALGDGETIISSLPEELRQATAKGCPFDAKMLAFILCEKYAYHSPINRVKKRLRDMGANFSKTTLNRYYHKGIEALQACLEGTIKEEMQKSAYLMIDETCELVGVKDEESGEVSYKKKYLWAFLDKTKKLVHYIYEKGSRGLSVIQEYLKGWTGSISTDGYVAYKAFTSNQPGILHAGCWAHARRLYVESLVSDHTSSMGMIETIAELFNIEYNCSLLNLSPEERRLKRRKSSRPILAKIYAKARAISKDILLMANPTLAKAVNYTLNQWENLRNFLLDGKVELSNNLVEQRMKPIKLDLKNSQNIGSEEAAKRHAFMHSLLESCSMNKIAPYEYLVDLLERYKMATEEQKVALLPCYYQK